MLKDRLANDVRRNGTYSSGTDDGYLPGYADWKTVQLQFISVLSTTDF